MIIQFEKIDLPTWNKGNETIIKVGISHTSSRVRINSIVKLDREQII